MYRAGSRQVAELRQWHDKGRYRMFALLRNFFSQFLADFDV
jgi:hypothetical protein